VAVGDYEQIETERRAAYKRMRRSPWGSEEHEELTRRHDDLVERRATYLRELLARLPFRWHIAHAYTPRETATYGGADHVVVDEPVRVGRIKRDPGDALSRPRAKFWGLYRVVENDRLPTSIADIKIAERILAAPITEKPKKTAKQLDREIAEAIDRTERG
jgi:hypothetical protein